MRVLHQALQRVQRHGWNIARLQNPDPLRGRPRREDRVHYLVKGGKVAITLRSRAKSLVGLEIGPVGANS